LQETEILFNTQIEALKKRLLRNSVIDIPLLLEEKAKNTVLYEILKPYHFNRQTVDDIIQSLTGEPGRQFFAPTHRLLKDRDQLIITEIQEETDVSVEINEETASIETPLKMTFCTLPAEGVLIEKDKNKAYFDADRLQFPLTLRHPQAGDSFVPFGMKGRKKLSDYFIDLKYSLIEKEKALVLLSAGNIIWLVGERTDERFRLSKTTRQVLCVEIND
jgi:tRNA(Ile)-lysidine synthase